MTTNQLLFIATDYKPRPGGIADYVDNLVRGLISVGNKTEVLAVIEPHKKERIAFLENYEEWVIPFTVVYDQRPKNWLGNKLVSLLEMVRCLSPNTRLFWERVSFFEASADAVKRLERILAEKKPTMVVFGHLDVRLYPFALLLLERKLPYVVIAHDFEIYRFPNKRNDLVRKGLMLKGAKWVAANSRHTGSLLEMWGIPCGRIKIVHPPIAEQAIRGWIDLEAIARKGSELNLVSVCRLVKSKGIDIVMHALKILTARGVLCQYIVGGDGPERRFLEALVDELGLSNMVHFKGLITEDEKWRLLRNSDVFVMPSRVDPKVQHEGFGIAFVEAAAFGLPGVGSKGGGIPDAVIDGETGILVAQDSPESLAEALTFLYRNPEKRKDMGRAGAKRAREEFSPTFIAARFQEEISKCIEQ